MRALNSIRPFALKHRRNLILFTVLLLVGCVIVIAKLTTDQSKSSVSTVKQAQATDVFTAAGFAQQVYDARLAAWDKEENTFITANPSWFTKDFLDKSTATGNASPSLFCKKVANKPERFEAKGSSTSEDKQLATVYVSGFYQGQMEVANLPLTLKADKGVWKIHATTCDFI